MIGQQLPDDDRTVARILKSLPTLNQDQLAFVHFAARGILARVKFDESQVSPEVDTSHIRDDELLGFDDLLRMTSRLPILDIHRILTRCEGLDRRLVTRGAINISEAGLYPDHPPLSTQSKSDTPEQKVDKIAVQSLLLDDNDHIGKLALLEPALRLAKRHKLPRTHIEAMILDITGGNRSKLIPGYESDLANARQQNEWIDVHRILVSLINESQRQDDKQAARSYLNQAKDFLSTIILTDEALSTERHKEGYYRLQLRTFYERLLQTERQLDDEM